MTFNSFHSFVSVWGCCPPSPLPYTVDKTMFVELYSYGAVCCKTQQLEFTKGPRTQSRRNTIFIHENLEISYECGWKTLQPPFLSLSLTTSTSHSSSFPSSVYGWLNETKLKRMHIYEHSKQKKNTKQRLQPHIKRIEFHVIWLIQSFFSSDVSSWVWSQTQKIYIFPYDKM